MKEVPFLTIDNETISVSKFVNYLRKAGSLTRILGEFLRQYVLEKELKTRDNIQVEESLISSAIGKFLGEHKLTDPNRFNKWLKENGLSYEEFKNQIALSLKADLLKLEITESQLEAYFLEKQSLFDRVVLSRIILPNAEIANKIWQQLQADTSAFEALAREHSVTEDRIVNGMMGPIKRSTLPEVLRKEMDRLQPGDIIGPFNIDDRYCIFRFEQSLPASLEGPVKQELQNQLFEKWLQGRIAKMNIKLEVR